MSPRSIAVPQTRCSIPHNGPRRPTTQHHPAPRAPKQANSTGVFGKNYRHRRPDQPRPTAPTSTTIRQILAVNVATSATNGPAIRHIVRNTRLWAISETCIHSSKFRFTVPGFDVIQHPATGPGRRGIALVSHRALVAMNMHAHSSPRHVWTDRQQWPDHFVIRTSIRAEAQGQPPAPRAPTISRHHCLEATDRIATSNYWDVLADGCNRRH
ncbi:hypothetical protein BASA81_018130 [Batrachochytrium salamandrivorans]|nr:hypothetical protein BASA81_018130 [Batrachochytrium salamandrivorans]